MSGLQSFDLMMNSNNVIYSIRKAEMYELVFDLCITLSLSLSLSRFFSMSSFEDQGCIVTIDQNLFVGDQGCTSGNDLGCNFFSLLYFSSIRS